MEVEDISWFKLIWTAFWVFIVAWFSIHHANPNLPIKEKLEQAGIATLIFTLPAAGYFFLLGSSEY